MGPDPEERAAEQYVPVCPYVYERRRPYAYFEIHLGRGVNSEFERDSYMCTLSVFAALEFGVVLYSPLLWREYLKIKLLRLANLACHYFH